MYTFQIYRNDNIIYLFSVIADHLDGRSPIFRVTIIVRDIAFDEWNL